MSAQVTKYNLKYHTAQIWGRTPYISLPLKNRLVKIYEAWAKTASLNDIEAHGKKIFCNQYCCSIKDYDSYRSHIRLYHVEAKNKYHLLFEEEISNEEYDRLFTISHNRLHKLYEERNQSNIVDKNTGSVEISNSKWQDIYLMRHVRPAPEKGTLDYIIWVMFGDTPAYLDKSLPDKYRFIEIFKNWVERAEQSYLLYSINEDYISAIYYWERVAYKCTIKINGTSRYVIQLLHKSFKDSLFQVDIAQEEYNKLKGLAIKKIELLREKETATYPQNFSAINFPTEGLIIPGIKRNTESPYSKKLKDPRWQKKRLEVFQRDEFTCQTCSATDKTLHVHHKKYQPGLNPWEYDSSALITLCEDCHKKLSNRALE